MIDYNHEVFSALSKVLPTHYEMALKSKTEIPCLSYMELNNYAITENIGATIGYSRITFQVKVWANDNAALQRYALEVDKALVPLGLKRVSSGELYDYNSALIQKIMTFEAMALEEI